MGDGVQVVTVLVVEALADVLPALPAIDGFEQRAVGAYRDAVLGVFEPDVQQGCLAFAILVLHRPALTAVDGSQDQRVMAHRPAVLVVDEVDSGQQLARRHLGLRPAGTVVIGIENVAPIARRNEAFTSLGDVEQKIGYGFRRLDGVAGLTVGSGLDWCRCCQQQERNGAAQ